MKAVQFRLELPRFEYCEIDEPALLSDQWVKIQTRLAGICGSDLGVIFGKGGLLYEGPISFPFVYGHEIFGTVTEKGEAVTTVEVGDRVVVDPILACRQRQVDTPCSACQRGDFSVCQKAAEGVVPPGILTGFTKDVGGGWGEYIVAHNSQVFRIPDSLADEDGILVEPFSVSLHGVMRTPPAEGSSCAVMGCGTIGLTTIAALKALNPGCNVIAVARYDFQAQAAEELDADHVVPSAGDDIVDVVSQVLGSGTYVARGKTAITEGVDVVYDCVASAETVGLALRLLGPCGKLVILGAPNFSEGVNWAPTVYREVGMVGAFCYSTEDYGGRRVRTFEVAIDLMETGKVDLKPLITHRFPLEECDRALEVAASKGQSEALKVLFSFQE